MEVYSGPIRKIDNTSCAGKTAIVYLPASCRYKTVYLDLTDTVAATYLALGQLIKEVRVRVNTQVKRTFSGPELMDFLELMGPQYAGYLVGTMRAIFPIHFTEPWRTPGDQEATGLVLGPNDTCQIEVVCTNGKANSTMTLAASADWDEYQLPQGQVPVIVHWTKTSFVAAGTKFDAPQISTIVPRNNLLQQITIYPDASARALNTTAQMTLRVNGKDRYDRSGADNLGRLKAQGMFPDGTGRGDTTPSLDNLTQFIPSTGVPFDMVIDGDGLLSSAIDMSRVIKDSLTIASAGGTMAANMNVIIQHLGPLY